MAAVLTCAIFVSVFASTNAEASFATFDKGDKFALKGENDLNIGYYSVNQIIKFGNEDSWLRDGTVDNASMRAYMSSVMLFEVIDVTDSEYIFKIVAAQNISLDIGLIVTGEIVDPGVYISDWNEGYSSNPEGLTNISEADTTTGTVGIEGQLVAGANETCIVHVQRSDMAIESAEIVASAYARGHLNAYNIPNHTTNWNFTNDIEVLNITNYDSFNSNITLDLNLTGDIAFEPYITAIRDSPEEGTTWEVDTYVNGTFNWTGLLDMTGLPETLTSEIFDEEAADMGITGFPIDLAKIYTPSEASPRLDNGSLAISAEDAFFSFSNLGDDLVNDPVYGNITIYRLGFDNATQENYLEAWYYPAEGVLVGIELNYPLGNLAMISLDMKSVPAEEAEETISDISEQVSGKMGYEEVSAAVVAGDSTDEGMGLLPIIGLIAVAVVAVVAAAFVMRRRSKPKA